MSDDARRARADALRDMRGARAIIDEALMVGLELRPPIRRPPVAHARQRRGGVRVTPQDRGHVHAVIAQLASAAAAGSTDAAAQARAVRRLLQSWENRQRDRRA